MTIASVKAVVVVAVEFDSVYMITERDIRERVTQALKASAIKVNDFDIHRYIISSDEGDPTSVREGK